MFTRLDAERNVKSMKRAVQTKRLSQDSYNTVIEEMNQYVSLPGRRLAELVKRYRHHCIMKDVGEYIDACKDVYGDRGVMINFYYLTGFHCLLKSRAGKLGCLCGRAMLF